MHSGKMIKRLRKARGLTQEELGLKLGVTKATIQKYESGNIVNLKVETMKKLCEIFNVDPVKFIFENENDRVKREVNAIEVIRDMYGAETVEYLGKTALLNDEGKNKAREFVDDLLEIERYRKKDAQL